MQQHYYGIKEFKMIKKIQPIKKEININNLSKEELKDLIIKIANKLNLEIKEK
jgi:hypothetical protein